MTKCTFCDAETKHPTGAQAIIKGWQTMRFIVDTPRGKCKHVIVACPNDKSKVIPEFERIMDTYRAEKITKTNKWGY